MERLPPAKERGDRRDAGDPRRDTLVCARLRGRTGQETQETGDFEVLEARSPYVVTFEPSFNFKNQARIHPQRFPADIAYAAEDSHDDVFRTAGADLVDITMAGGCGLAVALGQTGSGKTETYQQFLTRATSTVLERCKSSRKDCFVSFMEVR